ncbi:MAG: flagellar export chaperone FlgN [Thermotogaceae bacterium]|nr:flagellar export chaperone FlgN [Thermotogaceae bacterium]
MLKELIDVMQKEKELFEELINIIKEQKVVMIERDTEKMTSLSDKMEEVLFEIDRMDNERHELFNKYKQKLGLDEATSFDELLNCIEGEERENFINSTTDFLLTLNELAAELQGMREMMEFEKSYFDFVTSLLSDNENKGIYKSDGSNYSQPNKKVFDVRW